MLSDVEINVSYCYLNDLGVDRRDSTRTHS